MQEVNCPVIILIRPRIDIAFSNPNPPLGLGYLAASLEKKGMKVFIIDLTIRNITDNTLIQFIKKKEPLLVGLAALTPYYLNMKEIAKIIKKELPAIPIVLGGIHPSILPKESLNECDADYVVIGEGEQTLLELSLILKESGDVSHVTGIAFKRGREIIINPPRTLIDDLDTLPFPSWTKIDPRKYPHAPHGFIMMKNLVAPLMSSRGCPYKCSYCASCKFWNQRIRFRTATNVVDEIEYLQKSFGVKEFHFWDDNLTLNRSHILGICKEILRRRLKLYLSTPNGVRVDTLDEKILLIMKKAGFYHLTFSVESGSSMILKQSQKYTNLQKIARNTVIAKKLGFSLSSFFMIGFRNETTTTIARTIKFAKSLPFDSRLFFILKPLPGSQLFDESMKNIDLHDFDWTSVNFFKDNKDSIKIGDYTLQQWQKRAYRETILRLPHFIKFIWYRFIKYGHIFQLKLQIQRIMFVLMEKSNIFLPK
jgi:anaerobic magnesium-protoporphyrin IX monomethyl ester cyclase